MHRMVELSVRIILAVLLLPLSVSSYRTVCYSTQGENRTHYCFSNAPPFSGLPLPGNPFGENAPTFYRFRRSPNNFQIISSSNDLSLDHGLIVIVHGWMGTYLNTLEWNRPIMEHLFVIRPKVEMLFVEWEKGAALSYGSNPYDIPASNTRAIAAAISDFLLENKNFNASDCHCIGFSLGSHVCGFTGKRLKAAGWKSGWGRLTALDPAGPTFDVDSPAARVDKTDAEFVDAIHTSRLGLSRSVGDIDFYVSGAETQPGCRRRRRRWSLTSILEWATESYECSHVRAPLIFAQTIIAQPNYNLTGVLSDVTRKGPGSCTFSKFCPCSSLDAYRNGDCRSCDPKEAQIVGYWSFMRSKRGSFYGELTDRPPYCVEA